MQCHVRTACIGGRSRLRTRSLLLGTHHPCSRQSREPFRRRSTALATPVHFGLYFSMRQVDFVCVSYTRSGADVREVRTFVEGVPELAAAGVVAKVETRQALFNFRVRHEGRGGDAVWFGDVEGAGGGRREREGPGVQVPACGLRGGTSAVVGHVRHASCVWCNAAQRAYEAYAAGKVCWPRSTRASRAAQVRMQGQQAGRGPSYEGSRGVPCVFAPPSPVDNGRGSGSVSLASSIGQPTNSYRESTFPCSTLPILLRDRPLCVGHPGGC